MATNADIGLGIVFELHNGSSYDTIAEVFDITPPNEEADMIDVTHYGSTAREFIFGLTDFGECQLQMNLQPGSVSEDAILAAKAAGVSRSHRITFPSGHKWTFDGLVRGYEVSAPVDDRMVATVTSKVTGAVSRTDPS